jgi:hypothetical protein
MIVPECLDGGRRSQDGKYKGTADWYLLLLNINLIRISMSTCTTTTTSQPAPAMDQTVSSPASRCNSKYSWSTRTPVLPAVDFGVVVKPQEVAEIMYLLQNLQVMDRYLITTSSCTNQIPVEEQAPVFAKKLKWK